VGNTSSLSSKHFSKRFATLWEQGLEKRSIQVFGNVYKLNNHTRSHHESWICYS
jgi:hypothetical protein